MASGRRPGRPRGAQQDPLERRANLLPGAESAIREIGPDVSMEQIAERANVSKATLYDNFDGKGGLTEALIERYGLRLMTRFAELVQQPLTAYEVTSGSLAVFVHFIAEDPEIYRFVIRHADGEALVTEITEPIAALIKSLGAKDPVGLAYATLGAVVTATEWWTRSGSQDLNEFLESLVAFVWGGLVASGIDTAEDHLPDLSGVARAVAQARAEAAQA